MFLRDSAGEFRIRRFGLEIRDREVERFVLTSGFHDRSSAAADDELRRGGDFARRPVFGGNF